jgi:hypothetical protein
MPLKIDRLIANSIVLNGVETNSLGSCEITTSVYDIFPFPILPSLQKSCTIVNDTSEGGLDLEGWKLNGSVDLFGSTGYTIYLGTIFFENIDFEFGPPILSWKTSGNVTTNPEPGIGVNQPLSAINKLIDEVSTTIYVEPAIVTFFVEGEVPGVDIVLFVEQSPLDPTEPDGSINGTISFELELLTLKGANLTFEYNPPIV